MEDEESDEIYVVNPLKEAAAGRYHIHYNALEVVDDISVLAYRP